MLLPLLIAAIALLSICNAFTPSSILSPSSISQRRITTNNISGGSSNINNILTSKTTQLKMAQRMTPTRKTRKEDSFDRGQNDEKEEEGKFSCAAWCCGVWCMAM